MSSITDAGAGVVDRNHRRGKQHSSRRQPPGRSPQVASIQRRASGSSSRAKVFSSTGVVHLKSSIMARAQHGPPFAPQVFQQSHHHARRLAIENRAKPGAAMTGHDLQETDPVLGVQRRVDPALHPFPLCLGDLRPVLEDQQAGPARFRPHKACGRLGLLMLSPVIAVYQQAAATTVAAPGDFSAARDFALTGASALGHATLGQQLAPA